MKRVVALLIGTVVAVLAFSACQERGSSRQGSVPPMPLITADQIRGLEAAAKSQPKNPAGWVALGNALYDMNQCFTRQGMHQVAGCTDAAEAYAKALRLDPKNPNVLVDRGTALWAAGRFEAALTEHRKAMKIDPSHPHAHMNAAMALLALNRPSEAVRELETYLQLAPDSPDAQRVRGLLEELRSKGVK